LWWDEGEWDKQIAQEPSSLPTNSCEIFHNDDQEWKIVFWGSKRNNNNNDDGAYRIGKFQKHTCHNYNELWVNADAREDARN
jgi:hypothetical protein